MGKKIISILTVILTINSCYFPNSAGNLVVLDYSVDTKINYAIIRKYLDTLKIKKGYQVPEKWRYEIKQDDLDTNNNIRLYFKEDQKNPEEMYLISFNGQLLIADVFRKDHWVAVRKDMSNEEEIRVKNRFNVILDTIEKMAKNDAYPDSILYYKR